MRAALLVAMREYAENAKTKGFWIGLFMFPVLLGGSIGAQYYLEKSTPTRYYVMVDQSGEFEEVAERGFERLHQRQVLNAIREYIQENGTQSAGEIDLEQMPAIDPEEMMNEFAEGNPEALDAFVEQGGAGAVLAQMKGMLQADAPEFQEPRRRFLRVELPGGVSAQSDVEQIATALRPYLRGDSTIEIDGEKTELFAAILIPPDIEEKVVRPSLIPTMPGDERGGVQYWSSNLADDDLRDQLESVLNREVRRREYVAEGVDTEIVRKVRRTHVPFASLNPKKRAGQEQVSMADIIRQWAPVGFVYLLWIAIFSVSQMLLNNTIEEKSNRIIEVLLSSVTPSELMMGKLFGIAGIGLTMLLTWIACMFGVLTYMAGPEAEVATQLLSVMKGSGLLPAFIIYFILGYFLYSSFFLIIGSVCNTLKEAQNLMGPVMMIMIVPLITMMFIPKDPNGTLATLMSWIPIYTPFAMMNRAAADPPMFDIIGTMILLLVTTVFVMWLTGRIFRIAILRTGQPPKLMELLQWVRS